MHLLAPPSLEAIKSNWILKRRAFLLLSAIASALVGFHVTSSQAPSYASPKLSPTDSLTDGVKCRATSVAKKIRQILNISPVRPKRYFLS